MYKISKFLLFFFLFFFPEDVNSEVNLTEILDGKSQEITNKIIELNDNFQITNEEVLTYIPDLRVILIFDNHN